MFGKMADKFGAERVLLVGIVCFALSYVLLHTTQDFTRLIVVAVFGSAGFGACAPLVQSLALSSVPVERRGAASNTAFTGMDVGMLLGPVIGGNAIEMLVTVTGSLVQAYAFMWLIMIAPIALAFAVIISWVVRGNRHS